MFLALQKTALGRKHGALLAARKAARLYVSTQFSRTVSVKEPNDNFVRPCQWLVWSRVRQVGLLVSHEEANHLIPILQAGDHGTAPCHLIVYAAPITRRMLHFNDLNYYSIPPLPADFKAPIWLKVELGLFAGRLYFRWDEHEEIMKYLGTTPKEQNDESGGAVVLSGFAEKPLVFIHDWLAIRRKGQDFEHTPMGFVTTSKPLSATHTFFSKTEKESDEVHPSSAPATFVKKEENDDDSCEDDDIAKEHLFKHDDVDGEDVFFDAEEDIDEENTFFDGKAYVHADAITEAEADKYEKKEKSRGKGRN